MTYAVAAALQTAVYTRLAADAALAGLVGAAIYDAVPAGPLPPLYVVLGTEDVRDASDKTGNGADHALNIDVLSEAAGFASAKAAAGAVCDALLDLPLALSRGTLVSLRFTKAKALRTSSGNMRQITLTFRARVADDD
ncbi:DUF3168 domain-containing protein [Yoonia vestfoldensis]|uniref:Gene transfer agent protein n=1 Tax=Yoonia vestfoldensis TaxID=245188 RepID=A0A1Y0EC80_9RHOB|nr:DUF3168 domain-containing protein [Yoonia vestfoldensis]ARU01020.1 gene transfer agent protein [Yoonia vestfoldensis]